jgi:UDP-N-acetylmuramoylalanine--D-glutamate ligase
VGVADGWIVSAGIEPIEAARSDRASAHHGRVLPIAELAIPGRHNVANAMAAVSVGLLFGLAPEAIRRAVGAFRGVEHRLEVVAEVDGVRFVNDSQGTQPDAVIAALSAFEAPIVLIAGGRDKDVDLSELADVVAQRAAAAVLIGESAEMLERLFGEAGLGRIERAPTLEEAVDLADELARDRLEALRERGDGPPRSATVLLSPAAASFDMFVDYAARGRAFKAAVADLARRHAARTEESEP